MFGVIDFRRSCFWCRRRRHRIPPRESPVLDSWSKGWSVRGGWVLDPGGDTGTLTMVEQKSRTALTSASQPPANPRDLGSTSAVDPGPSTFLHGTRITLWAISFSGAWRTGAAQLMGAAEYRPAAGARRSGRLVLDGEGRWGGRGHQ